MTLFPKCFSSFDHSTCALSVSGPYLALDEIYHPFRAAFPNNSTRRGSFTQAQSPVADGILTLSDGPSQGTWTGTEPEASSPNYNSDPRGPDFKFELLPLHSPLLRQSRLVSFPPLIDMLKFSGYPYLIRGQPKGEDRSFDWTPGAWPTERWKMTTHVSTAPRDHPPGAATAFRARPPRHKATGGRRPNQPSGA